MTDGFEYHYSLFGDKNVDYILVMSDVYFTTWLVRYPICKTFVNISKHEGTLWADTRLLIPQVNYHKTTSKSLDVQMEPRQIWFCKQQVYIGSLCYFSLNILHLKISDCKVFRISSDVPKSIF